MNWKVMTKHSQMRITRPYGYVTDEPNIYQFPISLTSSIRDSRQVVCEVGGRGSFGWTAIAKTFPSRARVVGGDKHAYHRSHMQSWVDGGR